MKHRGLKAGFLAVAVICLALIGCGQAFRYPYDYDIPIRGISVASLIVPIDAYPPIGPTSSQWTVPVGEYSITTNAGGAGVVAVGIVGPTTDCAAPTTVYSESIQVLALTTTTPMSFSAAGLADVNAHVNGGPNYRVCVKVDQADVTQPIDINIHAHFVAQTIPFK